MLFDFCKSKRKSAGPSHSNIEVACLPVPLKFAASVTATVGVRVSAPVRVEAGVFVALNVGAGVFVAAKGFEVSGVASGMDVFASGKTLGVAPGAAVNQPFGARDGDCGALHAASPNRMQTLINKILLIIST